MDKQIAVKYWEERFGIPPASFLPYEFHSSTRTIYIARQSRHCRVISSLNKDFMGLPFLRQVTRFLKPTTVAAQRFGHLAKKNVIEIKRKPLLSLCKEGEIRWEKGPTITGPGYVILNLAYPESHTAALRRHFLGVSLFLEPGRLLCRLPKSMAKGVIAALERE